MGLKHTLLHLITTTTTTTTTTATTLMTLMLVIIITIIMNFERLICFNDSMCPSFVRSQIRGLRIFDFEGIHLQDSIISYAEKVFHF